ncbi:unnamed protein product [Cochlearia groenlandica]
MEQAAATRPYWCHMCYKTVNPLILQAAAHDIKCPFCQTGFVQEMSPPQPPPLQQQQQQQGYDDDLNQQLQAILTRRRQLSAAFNRHSNARLILIDPSTRMAVVHTSLDTLDFDRHTFLQPFALNDLDHDTDRYGTPPARKDAIKALPSVKMDETLQCPVCLDMFEIGKEARLMPCKHKFHGDCLLPWLELHSSCPVCRYLLPAAGETKTTGSTRSAETSHDNGSGSSRH